MDSSETRGTIDSLDAVFTHVRVDPKGDLHTIWQLSHLGSLQLDLPFLVIRDRRTQLLADTITLLLARRRQCLGLSGGLLRTVKLVPQGFGLR